MMMTMTKDPNVSLGRVAVHHMVRAMLLFPTRVCHTVFLHSILFVGTVDMIAAKSLLVYKCSGQ